MIRYSPAPGVYRANITMSEATVNALSDSGFSLYGFKAVSESDLATVPLVWLKTREYSLNTTVLWQEPCQAYTSFTPLEPPTPVVSAATYAISPGETLDVEQSSGVGVVVDDGSPGAFSILNETSRQFTCGILQSVNGQWSPLCAVPLHGGHLQVFASVAKVLLLFATQPQNAAAPVKIAYGSGVLIDFTGANERAVTYDINAGWSWGSFTWAQKVPAGAKLIPWLVERPSRKRG